MEDSIAREGTLARCNQDRNATADDPECINARRAASTAAARLEAARAERLEVESDLKREALRDRISVQQAAAQRADEAAQAAEEAAYDAQWSVARQPPPSQLASAPPSGNSVYGRSVNSPSTWDRPSPEVPIDERDRLSFIDVPQIESPADKALSGVELPPIAKPRQPEPRLEELTIPRPFRYPEPE